jgi:hypothetical protein
LDNRATPAIRSPADAPVESTVASLPARMSMPASVRPFAASRRPSLAPASDPIERLQERAPVGHHDQVGHQPDAACDRGAERQANKRVQRLVPAGLQPFSRRRRVIGQCDRIQSRGFHCLGELDYVLRVEPCPAVDIALDRVLDDKAHPQPLRRVLI